VGPLPEGSYTASLDVNGLTVATQAFTVTAPGPVLGLQNRFQARLAFGTSGGSASAVRLTDESGYFWFFDSGNVEVTVKILDGRLVNGHFWIFVASMTDRPFTLTVADTANPACFGSCPPWTYTSPGGKNTNFIDVNAF